MEAIDVKFVEGIARAHEAGLASAELFVADPSMVSLVDAAASTMPDQELRITDVPTGPNAGLVWFDGLLPDRSGTRPEVPLQALAWQTLPTGHELVLEGCGPSVLLTAFVRTGDLAAATREVAPDQARALTAFTTVVWEIGSLIGTAHGAAPPNPNAVPGFFQRVAAAFWALLSQPTLIDESGARPLGPSERRQHRRAGVIDPSATVRVIRVANRSGGAHTGATTGRTLATQHIVRGHWRRHWFPSLEEHRHIWIDPFVKGPAGSPLLGGERVFRAVGHTPVD